MNSAISFHESGPGAYDVRPRSTSPGISLKGRPQTKQLNDSPGPGAYEVRLDETGPAFSIR